MKSIDNPTLKDYESYKSQNISRNIEISLSKLDKKFNYRIIIVFEEEPSPIEL